jgi:hypothetical protein
VELFADLAGPRLSRWFFLALVVILGLCTVWLWDNIADVSEINAATIFRV